MSDVRNKKGAAAIIADVVKILEDVALPAHAKTVTSSALTPLPDAWWRRERIEWLTAA